MKEFLLPYGKEKLTAKIEDEHFAGVLLSELHSYKAPKSGAELVQEALEHPIGTPRLCDMAAGKKKIVVISSDHTRPVPSHIMMPLILAEIRKGNPDADITILISTGLHRSTTKEELAAKHSQATVDEATSHLNAAIEALVKAEAPVEVNTTELEKVIATAKDLKEADYTSETWNVFKGALELAESALENKESQEAVDSAAKELQSAIDGLKKADSETPAEVNTTELEKVIATAKALKEADYTSETWSALKTALETAESALEKKESQEAVDNAAKDLQTAIDGLKKVDNSNKGDDNKDNNNKNNNNKNNNTTNTSTTNKGTTTGTSTTNKGTTGTTATTNKGTTSTGTTGSKSTGTTSTSSNAKTGDPTSIWGWISLAVTSMGVGGFSWQARKKSRKDEEEK